MSAGLTYEELVTQVLYVEEKVLLDGLYPSDDKFREVITEANLMLKEFQNTEDWLWLRKTKPLGIIERHEPGSPFEIPSFDIDTEDVYKLSTMYGDAVHLYHHKPIPDGDDIDLMDYIIPFRRIDVPIVSPGFNDAPMVPSVGRWSQPNIPTFPLGCSVLDDKLVFNRFPIEGVNKIVVIDYQMRIPELHVCNDYCVGVDPENPVNWERGEGFNPCNMLYHIPEGEDTPVPTKILKMVPDPNYVVYKTAYYHALGSPVAQGNISYINDTCTRLLSAMRSNDGETTRPDIVRRYTPRWIEAI